MIFLECAHIVPNDVECSHLAISPTIFNACQWHIKRCETIFNTVFAGMAQFTNDVIFRQ